MLWMAILYSVVQFGFSMGLMSAPAIAADCNGNGQDDSSEFDVDGDGIIDACDNCLAIANASQLDSNDDGYGKE